VSEKVSIKIPAHLAMYIKPDASLEDKMKVINSGVTASSGERVTLLFFLCYDKDQEVKSAALVEMKKLPLPLVADVSACPDTHPRLRELLAKLYPVFSAEEIPAAAEQVEEKPNEPAEMPGEEEKEEEYQSKYQMAQSMGVGDKIKMALTGDKEWRSLLIKDSNKLVNGAVVKNPRITEPEILTIAKSVIQNEEILRVICHNKEWIKNYEIRKALVLNNKTPLPVALRFMAFLTEKDLTGMSKSKNISSVLANQARRVLFGKKKN
jgi:hypothetical protein